MVEVPAVGVVEVTAALVVRRGAGAVGALLVLAVGFLNLRSPWRTSSCCLCCLSGGHRGLPGE